MEFWQGNPNVKVEMNQLDKTRVEFKPISKRVARKVIVENHYSRRWPSAILTFGLYVDDKLNGVVVYGSAATARMADSLPSPNYLELQRLYSFDWAGKNTESYMIGASIRWIREHRPDIECLISFADPDQNHTGVVYQATNWLYCGLSDATGGYQYFFDGNWQHPRSTVARFGTRKHEEILKIAPDIEFKKVVRKHRYIYLVPKNKKRKKKLMKALKNKYEILPYPKLG